MVFTFFVFFSVFLYSFFNCDVFSVFFSFLLVLMILFFHLRVEFFYIIFWINVFLYIQFFTASPIQLSHASGFLVFLHSLFHHQQFSFFILFRFNFLLFFASGQIYITHFPTRSFITVSLFHFLFYHFSYSRFFLVYIHRQSNTRDIHDHSKNYHQH